MGRKKVRLYKSRDFYENLMHDYFKENKNEVIQYILDKTVFSTLEGLRDAEFKNHFGLDCGFVYLIPKNTEMYHEWELDEGKYCAKVYVRGPFNTQSVTLKELAAEKAVEDLNLDSEFYISSRLD